MNYSQRVATTSRPIITLALWDELRIHFLHSIAVIVATYKIPYALIFNIDQTPSKFITTSKVTMAEKGSKHVVAGSNDKRAITLTLIETLSGDILPFQVIYQGKTARCLPKCKYPDGFVLSFNESHWSNECETLRLLDEILAPYITKVKTEQNLPLDQQFDNLECIQSPINLFSQGQVAGAGHPR